MKTIRRISVLLVLSLIVFVSPLIALPPPLPQPQWLSGWNYRQGHVIQSAPGAGTEYQVKIKTYYDAPLGASKFTNFAKYSGNPLILPKPNGALGNVHPDVHYFPGGMDGYEYWMVYTPYPPDGVERPTIARSHDGITWTDTGITNPVLPISSGVLDADPDMIYVPAYGKWFMVWTAYTPAGSHAEIALAYSSDGKTWTKYNGQPVNGNTNPNIVSGGDSGRQPWESELGLSKVTEPTLLYENGTFHLFYATYIGGNNRGKVGFATFTWNNSTNSIENFQRNTANPVIDLPADTIFQNGCGHIDISKSGPTFYLYVVRQLQNSPNFELALLTSTDKTTWTNQGRVLQRGTGTWENVYIYRSAPVTDGVGNIIEYTNGSIALYYSAFGSVVSSGVGLATGTDAPSTLLANETSLMRHSRQDFGDVRFTASDGTTLLDYWMESKTDGQSATFWVKVPDNLGVADATIYLYYGKSDATTTSNIKNASLWNQGDDFNGTSLDSSWVPLSTGGASPVVTGGKLQLNLGYEAGIRGVTAHNADNLEMSLQVHAGQYVEMYLHNTAVTSGMLGTGDAGDIPTNYRIMLDSAGTVYAQKRLPDGSTPYHPFSTGSPDATLKLRVFNGMIAFLTGDHTWWSELWDSSIGRTCYPLIDGWGSAGQTDWVDNFWIRKYVEPEPSHGAWGGEAVNLPTLPTINSLSPSSATAGGPAFNLTVTGSNFTNGSVVRWNGSDRATTFISANQLSAAILASDIATAGTASVTVYNAGTGGGTSNAVSFTITTAYPAPTINSLTPSSANVGGNGFTLTVKGTNFVRGSSIRWNGDARATTYYSATELRAAIPAADIAIHGTVTPTVANPAPGGGVSNGLPFQIKASSPTISSISPTSAIAGGPSFTLTVNGSNFVTDSVVRWNGANRPTTYVSKTRLTAAIPSSDIATSGTAKITVFTPSPGGGTSGSKSLAIK